jgi:Permuted papain-like amidase enzyme, YaeF/YiiX, C92 family
MKWKRAIFFLTVVIFISSCGGKAPSQFAPDIKLLNKRLIKEVKATIHSGDVILRSGKDFTSYRIRELSDKDKTYSHAGIAWVQDTNVYIYHITPPDIDEPKADTAMRVEKLEYFADPSKCFGFGIVRYSLSEPEINTALIYLDSLHKKKISFDHYFDLRNQNQMYCSEMVDNTFRYATHNRIKMDRKYFTTLQAVKASRYFNLPMEEVTKRAYISIDNLELNPNASIIHNYVFLK